MIENVIYYLTIIICISIGSFYKKINDLEMKRNYGVGLGLFVACLVCGHHVYHSILLVWGNIIIIKCCDKSYVHQMSLAYTWIYLQYMHLHLFGSIHIIWMHQTIALRLVGLAFEVHLSSKGGMKPESKGNDKYKHYNDGFVSEPAAVDIIAYSFYFIGLHRGPYYRWKIFEDHLTTPFGVLGDCRIITEHKIKKAIVCGVGYLMLRMKYTPEAYYDNKFYTSISSESRYLYSIPQLVMYFLQHQMIMMLCTSVCTEAGFGVYPAQCASKPGHGPTTRSSLLNLASKDTTVALQQEYNFSMLKCYDNKKLIFGPRMRDTILGWDMSVQYWFSSYIYKQLVKGNKETMSACSLVAWCMWNGSSLPQLLMSVTLWVYMQLEAEYSQLYRSDGTLTFQMNLGFSMMRMFCLLYLTPCLVVRETSVVFRFYNSIYWVFHILMLALLLVIAVIQKARSASR